MKYIFSILFMLCVFGSFAQTPVRDTLIVMPSGALGQQSFYRSPDGDTLYLKNFPILTSTSTLNFPSIPGRSTASLTLSVPGAVQGDVAVVGPPDVAVLIGVIYIARVSAPNTVTVTAFNSTTGAKNPAPGPFKIRVLQ